MADLTTNRVPKATAATVIGDSSILDDSVHVTLTLPVIMRPEASATPPAGGDLVFEKTSNTTLTIKFRGSDGTVRSVALTLA